MRIWKFTMETGLRPCLAAVMVWRCAGAAALCLLGWTSAAGAAGAGGMALNLFAGDEAGDYVDVPPFPFGGGPFTLEAWVRARAPSRTRSLSIYISLSLSLSALAAAAVSARPSRGPLCARVRDGAAGGGARAGARAAVCASGAAHARGR